MKNMYTVEDRVQFRRNSLILYSVLHPGPPQRSKEDIVKDFGEKVKAYEGSFSQGAKKRMSKSIDIMMQRNPNRQRIYNPVSTNYFYFRFNFITLTVSSKKIISTSEAYKNLLRPFLQNLSYRTDCDYIWKVEPQKRKQPHYHITTNRFIEYDWIRNTWNKHQRKSGYLNGYVKRFGSYNANSTDVHAVKKVKNFGAYMMKYLTKDFKKPDNFDSKIWGCSESLNRSRYSCTVDYEMSEKLRKLRFKTYDNYRIYFCDKPLRLLNSSQLIDYKNHIL